MHHEFRDLVLASPARRRRSSMPCSAKRIFEHCIDLSDNALRELLFPRALAASTAARRPLPTEHCPRVAADTPMAPPNEMDATQSDSDDDDILEQMRAGVSDNCVPRPECSEYDLKALRQITDRCPPKILSWALQLWGEVDRSSGSSMPRHVEEAQDVESSASRGEFGKKLVPSLPGSRRRLFGEPELHQRVLGVLNKVTDDSSKYPHVRNELFRLPLPEADAQSLTKVVKTFFKKAVMEQRFSSNYAELVADLCIVPQGQTQLGNVKKSLSYQLRRALLRTCQEYFERPVARQGSSSHASPEEAEEALQKEKMKLCGNVKFVGELYLRRLVAHSTIEMILLRLFWGTATVQQAFAQPSHDYFIPDEIEFDQVLTLLKTTGKSFQQTDCGKRLLPPLRTRAIHFAEHHTIIRVRLLMQNVADIIQAGFEKRRTPSPPTATPTATSSNLPLREEVAAPTRGRPPPLKVNPARTEVKPPSAVAEDTMSIIPQPRSSQPKVSSTQSSSGSSSSYVPSPRNGTRVDGSVGKAGAVGSSVGTEAAARPTSSHSSSVASFPPSSTAVFAAAVDVGTLMNRLRGKTNDKEMQEIAQLLWGGASAGSGGVRAGEGDGGCSLRVVLRRAINTIRLEEERRQIAPLLRAIASLGADRAALQQEVHAAMHELISEEAFESNRKLWRLWAHVVSFDVQQEVLHHSMHTEVLEKLFMLPSMDPAVNFTYHVLSYNATSKEAEESARESTREKAWFRRFRPFDALCNFAIRDAESGKAKETIVSKFVEDVCAKWSTEKEAEMDPELLIFSAIVQRRITVKDMLCKMRKNEHLQKPQTPGKVLSAILYAEAIVGDELLSKYIEPLAILVDGKSREAREEWLFAEQLAALQTLLRTHWTLNLQKGIRCSKMLVERASISYESLKRVRQLFQSQATGNETELIVALLPDLVDHSQFSSLAAVTDVRPFPTAFPIQGNPRDGDQE